MFNEVVSLVAKLCDAKYKEGRKAGTIACTVGDTESVQEGRGKKEKMEKIERPSPKALRNVRTGVWITGKAGIGKTTLVQRVYKNVFEKTHDEYWNGYGGERNVVINDVDKTNARKLLTNLKLWADCTIIKGKQKHRGPISLRPRRIIVTSQYTPRQLYKHKDLAAITRRFAQYKFTRPLFLTARERKWARQVRRPCPIQVHPV